MSDAAVYYRHSGKFGITALPAMMIVGAMVAVVLGLIYGIAVLYIPIIFLNVLLTVGLGFAVGWVVFSVAKLTHVRSPLLALTVGLIAGIVAEWAAFVGWIAALSEGDFIILDPVLLAVEVLPAIAEQGVWGLSESAPVTGMMLYAVWLIEAAIIILIAGLLPFRKLASLAYCEDCRAWVRDRNVLPAMELLPDAQTARKSLEQGDFSLFGQFKAVPAEQPQYTEVALSRCGGCDALHLMTMDTVQITQDSKGNTNTNRAHIVENLLIDGESRELILQIAQTPLAAGDAATAETDSEQDAEPVDDAQPSS